MMQQTMKQDNRVDSMREWVKAGGAWFLAASASAGCFVAAVLIRIFG